MVVVVVVGGGRWWWQVLVEVVVMGASSLAVPVLVTSVPVLAVLLPSVLVLPAQLPLVLPSVRVVLSVLLQSFSCFVAASPWVVPPRQPRGVLLSLSDWRFGWDTSIELRKM